MDGFWVVDYGNIITKYRMVTLKDFPHLKIQQDFKTRELVAVGDGLSKLSIELPLESLLMKEFHAEMEVRAEEFPGTSNRWKISLKHEGIALVVKSICHS